MSQGNQPSPELAVLLESLLEGRLSESQQARLNELVTVDADARRAYVQYMTTIAGVRRYLKGRPAFLDGINEPLAEETVAASEVNPGAVANIGSGAGEEGYGLSVPPPPVSLPLPGDAGSALPVSPPPSGVLGFISTCFAWGQDLAAKPMAWGLALALGLLSALLIVVLPSAWHRPSTNSVGSNVPAHAGPDGHELVFIARITDSYNAHWQDGAILPVGKSLLAVGQKLTLVSGLVEISFDNGAKMILEGPAELVLDSPIQATLAAGQLTAEIPEQAIGFTVQTPMVNVIDLGTKFGVRVSPKGMTDVAVFSGEVIASPRDAATDPEQATHVVADEVRRFWNGSTVDEEPLESPDFSRSIPKFIEIENPSFELPRIGGWLSREIEGWTIVSQPAWKGPPNGGVQLAAAERVQIPAPPSGQQWAFLETRIADDRTVIRTSMHQAVAKLAPNVDYRLRITLGREGFVPNVSEGICYPFSSFDGVEIGLWSGPDKQLGPTEPLKIVRDPLPRLAAKSAEFVTLTYRSPPQLPPGEQWLFIRLSVGSKDWNRVLFDDVQLEAVPVGEIKTAEVNQ